MGNFGEMGGSPDFMGYFNKNLGDWNHISKYFGRLWDDWMVSGGHHGRVGIELGHKLMFYYRFYFGWLLVIDVR